MEACHRLVGNPPQRGFGEALLSPDFPGSGRLTSGNEIRLPKTGVPGARAVSTENNAVERYRIFEVQPISYGVLSAIQSSCCAVKNARASYYTDIVVPEQGGRYSLEELGCRAEKIIRFNGFIPLNTFWYMPKEQSSLDKGEWTTDEPFPLSYDMPDVLLEQDKLNALLAAYWHAASLQYFGPWDKKHSSIIELSQNVLLSNLTQNATTQVIVDKDTNWEVLIRNGKAFFAKVILENLPQAVENIASVSIGVPVTATGSMFSDSAMCIIYPDNDAGVTCDLRQGKQKVDGLSGIAVRFLQDVREGNHTRLLDGLTARWKNDPELGGCMVEADYDLRLALYRIETGSAENAYQLLKQWYVADKLLQLRHHIGTRQASALLTDTADCLAEKLGGSADQLIAGMQIDPNSKTADVTQTEENEILLPFLWSKLLNATGEKQTNWLKSIIGKCQQNAIQPALPELIAKSESRLTEAQADLAAELLRSVSRNESTFRRALKDESRLTEGFNNPAYQEEVSRFAATREANRDLYNAAVKADPDWVFGSLAGAVHINGKVETAVAFIRRWKPDRIPSDGQMDAIIPILEDRLDGSQGLEVKRHPDVLQAINDCYTSWTINEVAKCLVAAKRLNVETSIAIRQILRSVQPGVLTQNQTKILVGTHDKSGRFWEGLCTYCQLNVTEELAAYAKQSVETALTAYERTGDENELTAALKIVESLGQLDRGGELDAMQASYGFLKLQAYLKHARNTAQLPALETFDDLPDRIFTNGDNRAAVKDTARSVIAGQIGRNDAAGVIDSIGWLRNVRGLDSQEADAIAVQSFIDWKNQRGYMPDELYGMLRVAVEGLLDPANSRQDNAWQPDDLLPVLQDLLPAQQAIDQLNMLITAEGLNTETKAKTARSIEEGVKAWDVSPGTVSRVEALFEMENLQSENRQNMAAAIASRITGWTDKHDLPPEEMFGLLKKAINTLNQGQGGSWQPDALLDVWLKKFPNETAVDQLKHLLVDPDLQNFNSSRALMAGRIIGSVVTSAEQNDIPSDEMFDLLRTAVDAKKRKDGSWDSAAFLKVWEKLLPDAKAKEQLQAFFQDDLLDSVDHQTLPKAYDVCLGQLCESLSLLMRTQGYWPALTDGRLNGQMKKLNLTDRDLMDALTEAMSGYDGVTLESVLHRELDTLETTEQFLKHAVDDARNDDRIQGLRRSGRFTVFHELALRELRDTANGRKERLYRQIRTAEDLRAAREAWEKIGIWEPGDPCCGRIRKIADLRKAIFMDGSIDAVLAGRDPDTCDEVARNVLALDWQNNRHMTLEWPFEKRLKITRVICASAPREAQWDKVLSELLPQDIEKIDRPYAKENLSTLSALTAVVNRLYREDGREWWDSFMNYLRGTKAGNYSMQVAKDRAALAVWFPEPRSEAVDAWLQPYLRR